ncbi:hypothetical protein MHYP_G00034100 [Metynnis hypsauchen]
MVLNLPLTLLTADHNEGRYDEKGLKSCRTSCSSCLFLGTVPPQEECRPPKITNCQIKSDNMAARTRSAPEHFQKRMTQILEGLEGVLCQMDDVLFWRATQEQHDERLHVALSHPGGWGHTQ